MALLLIQEPQAKLAKEIHLVQAELFPLLVLQFQCECFTYNTWENELFISPLEILLFCLKFMEVLKSLYPATRTRDSENRFISFLFF